MFEVAVIIVVLGSLGYMIYLIIKMVKYLIGDQGNNISEPIRDEEKIKQTLKRTGSGILDTTELKERLSRSGVTIAPSWIPTNPTHDFNLISGPKWRGKYFLEDRLIKKTLEHQFLNQLESFNFKKEILIIPITPPARGFLQGIEEKMKPFGVSLSGSGNNKNSQYVLLFDLVINTGRTMIDAYDFLENKEKVWYSTILFNDFIPIQYRNEEYKLIYDELIGSRNQNKSYYLYKATELIDHFDHTLKEELQIVLSKSTDGVQELVEELELHNKLVKDWYEKKFGLEP